MIGGRGERLRDHRIRSTLSRVLAIFEGVELAKVTFEGAVHPDDGYNVICIEKRETL